MMNMMTIGKKSKPILLLHLRMTMMILIMMIMIKQREGKEEEEFKIIIFRSVFHISTSFPMEGI